MREGRLDLGDLRAESLELRNEFDGPIPLSLERRRGSTSHLVELGDTPHEVLVARPRVPQCALRAVTHLIEFGDLLARDLPVRSGCGSGVNGGSTHGTRRVLLELAREGRCALRNPQVMAVRCCGVRELRSDGGLAKLVRCAEKGRAQQVCLHGGIHALVDGAQRRRGLRQRVGVCPHEAQGLGCLLDAQGQRLALGFDRGDARRRRFMLGVQRLDLRARLGQRALDRQGFLERAARARRLVAQTLRPLAEISHGLGRERLWDDGGCLAETGGERQDLVAGPLQARERLLLGGGIGSDSQRSAGVGRALSIGEHTLLSRHESLQTLTQASVFGLSLRQSTPLGQGVGGLASGRTGHLSNVQGLLVRFARASAGLLGPTPHRARILRARVQLVAILVTGCALVGSRPVRVRVLAQGTVEGPHALTCSDGGHAPLLDAALRRGCRFDESLREVGVDLRVENVAQDLLAVIRGGGEELGELALRQHDRLEELVLI